MNFIKKLFSLEQDCGAIGLCRFANNSIKEQEEKTEVKKSSKKDITLTQMLKRDI